MGVLAITGGEKAKTKAFVKYPIITEDDRTAVLDALESGNWARTGNHTASDDAAGYTGRLERKFKEMQNSKYGLALSNGTIALETAIQCLGTIAPGDEVIVTPYTFIASASCILKAGAVPVFADIDRDTWNIDPVSIEKNITAKTKAIVVVHFAGQSAMMSRIYQIAQAHGLAVIGDAAHACSAEWDGRMVSEFADITCFSLQSSKNVTCGEGGMLLTDNEEYYQRAYSLHMAGRSPGGSWYQHHLLGSNYRITELQAALACSQLKYHQEREAHRRKQAAYLISGLSEIEGIEPAKTLVQAAVRDYHLITLRYDREQFGGLSRKRFIMALCMEGVPCHEGYQHPLYKNPLFQAYEEVQAVDYEGRCPAAEKLCQEAIWLHQDLLLGDKEDMDEIILAFRKVKENLHELVRRRTSH